MSLAKLISKSTLERLYGTHWRKRLIVIAVAILAIEGSVLASIIHRRDIAEHALAKEKLLAVKEAKFIASKREVHSVKTIPPRTTFGGFLADQGIQSSTIHEVVHDTRPVYNLATVHAGNEVTFVRSGKGVLREIGYEIDPEHMLWIKRHSPGFDATVRQIPFTMKVAEVSGTVHSSLFTAVEHQGEHDQLAIKFANIFAWDFDFNTDTQRGDRFEAVVQKKYLNGQFAGYGHILAAEYDSGSQRYQALLFHDPSGQPAYYAPSGKAVKKAFLRSPLLFAAPITSHFSYHRFHPILKRYLPHLGIDYGAPIGSKVQAVADGRVIFAGWDRGGGREIKLRHANGYETFYLHLSRIQVHVGEHVHQGEIIARTGDTGLSTGPHLDFRIMIHGKFRNFLALKLPPARSVAKKDWPQFAKLRGKMLAELSSLRTNMARVQQASLHSSALPKTRTATR